VSSDCTSDDVDEIVESNIPAEPSQSFEFPCADYGLMIVPTELSSSELSEFLVMIQHIICGVSSFIGCLEFVPKFSIPPLEGLDCPPRHPVYFIFFIFGRDAECLLYCICLWYMIISLNKYQFAMTIITLLHIHIVFCRSSQLIIGDCYESL